MERTDAELFWAALRRAPNHGESSEIRALRDYTHAEGLAGRIDADTQDQIGRLIDALSAKQASRVDDLIGPNATDIPWDVLEVVDSEGSTWRRAFGDDRYAREDDGSIHLNEEYDWVTAGGWSTTSGLLDYAPLRVTKVAQRPNSEES